MSKPNGENYLSVLNMLVGAAIADGGGGGLANSAPHERDGPASLECCEDGLARHRPIEEMGPPHLLEV